MGDLSPAAGDKNMMKLVEPDNNIGLANRATTRSVLGKAHSTGPGSDGIVYRIMVLSSFMQTSADKP